MLIPKDVWWEIFGYMDIYDLIVLSSVCVCFNNLADQYIVALTGLTRKSYCEMVRNRIRYEIQEQIKNRTTQNIVYGRKGKFKAYRRIGIYRLWKPCPISYNDSNCKIIVTGPYYSSIHASVVLYLERRNKRVAKIYQCAVEQGLRKQICNVHFSDNQGGWGGDNGYCFDLKFDLKTVTNCYIDKVHPDDIFDKEKVLDISIAFTYYLLENIK